MMVVRVTNVVKLVITGDVENVPEPGGLLVQEIPQRFRTSDTHVAQQGQYGRLRNDNVRWYLVGRFVKLD
jgi:hypothetical protein